MREKIQYFKDNHKISFYLFTSLLFLLNLFFIVQILPVFRPIISAFQIIFPPLIASVIAFYVLNPFVDFLNQYGLSRVLSTIIVFLAVILLITLGILYIVPIVNEQVSAIVELAPAYWEEGLKFLQDLLGSQRLPELLAAVQEANFLQTLSRQTQNLFQVALGGIGSVISITTQVVITTFTVPFILYFMLVDPGSISSKIVRLTPVKFRSSMERFIYNVHSQLGVYVRGQIFVAFCVAIIFLIGYAAIGLDFYLILAIIAGVFNLVPYLGSFLSGVLAVIIALFQDPILVVYLVVVFIIEQILENRVIQPLVLGSQLNIHPITILFVLLVSASSFGVVGVLLGVPVYAVLKIIVTMAFEYIEDNTELYNDDSVSSPEDAILKDE